MDGKMIIHNSHLKNQSSDLISGENSAVLFKGCISRERVRNSRLNNLSKLSFFETRTVLDKDYCHSKGDEIANQLGRRELVLLGAIQPSSADPPRLVADITRLHDEVGFRPVYNLISGIMQTIEHLKASEIP